MQNAPKERGKMPQGNPHQEEKSNQSAKEESY